MKTLRNVLWMVVGVAALLVLPGCASNKRVDQLAVQTTEQAKRAAVTEQVLLELAKRGSTVIPDTIATVEPGSMVGWAQATRAIRTEENKPLVDKDGKAQMETTTAIGKVKSDRAFGALTTGTIKLAALGFDLKEGKLVPTSLLEGAVVYVESDKGDSTLDSAHAAVYANAVAAEKTVILAGMANLATARGAAFAVRFTAIADGTTKVLTQTGELVGKVLAATVVPVPTDLISAGVTKLVQAVVKQTDGTSQTILAADTPTSTAATDCVGCQSPTGQ